MRQWTNWPLVGWQSDDGYICYRPMDAKGKHHVFKQGSPHPLGHVQLNRTNTWNHSDQKWPRNGRVIPRGFASPTAAADALIATKAGL